MLEFTQFSTGDLRFTIYDFGKVGDVLPPHVHLPEDRSGHVTVVADGRVELITSTERIALSKGDVVDIADGEVHSFEALEPRSRIVNVVKYMGS